MGKRRAVERSYFKNSAAQFYRGGASLAHVFIENVDTAANAMTLYALNWLPWHYPDAVFNDGFTYVFQNIGGTLGPLIGAVEYTAVGTGVQMYTTGLPQQANNYIHDLTTWTVEFFFRTGSDVTTTIGMFGSWQTASVISLNLYYTGGRLNINHNTGTNTGPFIAANTTYHLIVTYNGTTIIWYLNGVATNGTGAVPTAAAAGAAPQINLNTPLTGSVGFLTVSRGVALNNIQASIHYAFYIQSFRFNPIVTSTMTAGSTFNTMLGRGGAYPLPDVIYLFAGGQTFVTVEWEM